MPDTGQFLPSRPPPLIVGHGSAPLGRLVAARTHPRHRLAGPVQPGHGLHHSPATFALTLHQVTTQAAG